MSSSTPIGSRHRDASRDRPKVPAGKTAALTALSSTKRDKDLARSASQPTSRHPLESRHTNKMKTATTSKGSTTSTKREESKRSDEKLSNEGEASGIRAAKLLVKDDVPLLGLRVDSSLEGTISREVPANELGITVLGKDDEPFLQASPKPLPKAVIKEDNVKVWYATQSFEDKDTVCVEDEGWCGWWICSTCPVDSLKWFLKLFFPYWCRKTKRIKAPHLWDLKLIMTCFMAQIISVAMVYVANSPYYNAFFAIGFSVNVQLLAIGLPEWHFWFKEGIADQHSIGRKERALHVIVPILLYLLWGLYPLVDSGWDGYNQCRTHRRLVPTVAPTPEDNSKMLYYFNLITCPLISCLSILTSLKGNSSTAYSASCIRCIAAISFNAAGMLGYVTIKFCRSKHEDGIEDILAGYLMGLFSSWAVLFVFTTTLVFRRVAALALTSGKDTEMERMTVVFYISSVLCVLGMGFVSITSEQEGVVRKTLSVTAVLAGLLAFALFGFKVIRFFHRPVQILKAEVEKTVGPAQAEAQWAMTVMLWEYRASVATMGTSLIYGIVLVADLFQDKNTMDGWVLPVMYVVDALTNTFSIMSLSGVLQSAQRDDSNDAQETVVHKAQKLKLANELSKFEDVKEWKDKVYDLAGRGFTLERLLDFFCSLGKESFPHYNPDLHTTNDVARQCIIPMSRTEDGGGKALATVWNGGAFTPPDRFVTHHWDNVFSHLVAAIVADGMDSPCFEEVMIDMKEGKVEQLKAMLRMKGTLERRYWVCAFCINQHACICGGFGPPPPEGTSNYKAWQRKRKDTVTKQVFDLCPCNEKKYFSDHPIECEVNKFDSLMAFLLDEHDQNGGQFSQMIACDTRFDLFTRAWCVAELVEADCSNISQHMRIFSKKSLDKNYKKLASLDVEKCEASRIEDKHAILAKIEDSEAFNERLQWLIFGQGGLLSSWMDGQSKVAGAGRVLQRVMRRASTRNSVYSSGMPKSN